MSNCIVCNDKEKAMKELLEDRDNFRNQLLDTCHELKLKNRQIENQKAALENLNKTLELITKENKHLWGLIKLQAAEKNV